MKSAFVIFCLFLIGIVLLLLAGVALVIWLMRQVDRNPHGTAQEFREGFDD